MTEMTFRESFLESIEIKKQCVELGMASLVRMGEAIVKAIKSGNKLIICGNGGSAADAQHLAAELLIRLRPTFNRIGLPAITLAQDTSTLTACGNDFGYKFLYQRVLQSLGREGDVLLVITTSGNSENIILAIDEARRMNISVMGFLGKDGGKALPLCDETFMVPSNNTARIQEAHITAGHGLMEFIENELIESGMLAIGHTGL